MADTLMSMGTCSVHSSVKSGGVTVNTGAVVSSTVMTCVAEVELPEASVAVNVRVIT